MPNKSPAIKIDKGVPLVPKCANGKLSKYPWRTMNVGDSFFCTTKNIQSACSYAALRTGFKFESRKENNGFRVWRTK